MTFFWILIAGAVTWLGLALWRRRARAATKGRPPRTLAEQARSTPPVAASDTTIAAPPPATVDPAAPPAELAALRMLHADDVDPRRVAALMNVLRDIPRPPRVLQQILSPDGLEQMSSSRLVELISAEPLFAAEVLRITPAARALLAEGQIGAALRLLAGGTGYRRLRDDALARVAEGEVRQ